MVIALLLGNSFDLDRAIGSDYNASMYGLVHGVRIPKQTSIPVCMNAFIVMFASDTSNIIMHK